MCVHTLSAKRRRRRKEVGHEFDSERQSKKGGAAKKLFVRGATHRKNAETKKVVSRPHSKGKETEASGAKLIDLFMARREEPNPKRGRNARGGGYRFNMKSRHLWRCIDAHGSLFL